MTTNINTQEQNYKRIQAINCGVMAGSLVQVLTNVPHYLVAPKLLNKMGVISNSLTTDEFTQVEKAVKDTMKQSGLDKKGVSVIKATANNAEEITAIMRKEIDKGIFKWLPQKIKQCYAKSLSNPIVLGKNACYTFFNKKIVMPQKELGLAFFHEAGHAMNANFSKFGKILQRCRPMTLLLVPITLIGLYKIKKQPNEKPKTSCDKVTTFVKNNAGILAFATFIPTLLEEGLATLKGNNFAKKLLTPQLAKKVAKSNALGFSTYLLLATLSSLGVYWGAKVKDSVTDKTLATLKNNT